METFWPLQQVELHRLSFVQRAVPVLLDGGEMDEHILATGPLDEAVALGPIEPLHCSLFSCITHNCTPFASASRNSPQDTQREQVARLLPSLTPQGDGQKRRRPGTECAVPGVPPGSPATTLWYEEFDCEVQNRQPDPAGVAASEKRHDIHPALSWQGVRLYESNFSCRSPRNARPAPVE